MRILRIKPLIVALLLLLLPSAVIVIAESQVKPEHDRISIAENIREAVERLETLNAKRREVLNQHHNRIAVITPQIDNLRLQSALLDSEVKELETAVADLRIKVNLQKSKVKEKKGLLDHIAKSAFAHLTSIRSSVVRGVPFEKQKRTALLDAIADGLISGDALRIADSFDDLWRFVERELQLAKSVEIWNEHVLLDDGRRLRHAWQVRIGMVNQFFVSEDNEEIGIALRNGGWLLKRPSELGSLLKALHILQKRSYPDIIPVHIVLPSPSTPLGE